MKVFPASSLFQHTSAEYNACKHWFFNSVSYNGNILCQFFHGERIEIHALSCHSDTSHHIFTVMFSSCAICSHCFCQPVDVSVLSCILLVCLSVSLVSVKQTDKQINKQIVSQAFSARHVIVQCILLSNGWPYSESCYCVYCTAQVSADIKH